MKKVFLIIIFLILSILIWSLLIEPNMLTVRRVTIDIPNWPKELDNLNIVVIGDIHGGSQFIDERKLDQIVKLVNSENPDLVLLLGDYMKGVVGGRVINPEITAGKLAKINADYGKISVLGNHDWWFNGYRVRKALENSGIKVLENESVKITYNKKSFWISGIADLYDREVYFDKTFEKIHDKNPIIMLSHTPDILPVVPQKVSLTLAGHVHGGQFRLPFVGPIITPSLYGSKYSQGLVVEKNKYMFVTNGIGTSILPVRFLCPPEIVVLKLK